MPPPFDSVVSIGGQSFVDGIWRLLGPALQGLTNPLPLALPGFTNAAMRITQIVPVFPGTPPPTGGLQLLAAIEVTGEALLTLTVTAGEVAIALGTTDIRVTDLAGTIGLPAQNGDLTDLALGTLGSGGTGRISLPGGPAALSGGSFTGQLDLPSELRLPGLPLPAVVPVPVDLIPSGRLVAPATLVLVVNGTIDAASRFGLRFSVGSVDVGTIAFDPAAVAATLTPILQGAIDGLVAQLGIPVGIVQRRITDAGVTTLLTPLPDVVGRALDDALTGLLAETGRLIYPPAGAGSSCDINLLPTAGDASLTAPDGNFLLQVGFSRSGSSDIGSLPSFMPVGLLDVSLLVGNSFLLDILCCLVERLPAFGLPAAAATGTTDINGATHVRCCNFTAATVNLGPLAIGGGAGDGLSVCIDGMTGSSKTFSLIGHFAQAAPPIPLVSSIAAVTVDFTLPVTFDVDDAAALANLKILGAPTVAVGIAINPGLVALLVVTGVLFIGPAVGLTAVLLVTIAYALLTMLLGNAVRTVLGGASLIRSPVAVPPGLFEAFGGLAPVTVMVDDLVAEGVLHTPTSPWGLLPRIGLGKVRDRPRQPPLTHGSLTHG